MPQKFLSVRQSDYERCQTKSRNAPWIKLYRDLWGDREFLKLSPTSRFLYIGILMLSTETGNKVYNDRTWIGQRLYMPCTEIDLTPLYRGGFLVTSNLRRVLSEREGEREQREREKETETPAVPAVPRGFEVFWMKYPRKKSKGQAEKAWAKIKPDELLCNRILDALERAKNSTDWTKDGGMYIPYPASWLNAKGWEDEPTAVVPLRAQPVIPPKPPANDPIGRGLWEQSFGSLVKSMR